MDGNFPLLSLISGGELPARAGTCAAWPRSRPGASWGSLDVRSAADRDRWTEAIALSSWKLAHALNNEFKELLSQAMSCLLMVSGELLSNLWFQQEAMLFCKQKPIPLSITAQSSDAAISPHFEFKPSNSDMRSWTHLRVEVPDKELHLLAESKTLQLRIFNRKAKQTKSDEAACRPMRIKAALVLPPYSKPSQKPSREGTLVHSKGPQFQSYEKL